MLSKLMRAIGGLAVVGVIGLAAFGAIGHNGTAFADDPSNADPSMTDPAPSNVCVGGHGDHGFYDHAWLRRSIVNAAADTIGIPNSVVVDGLQHGLSLKQIAYLNNVGVDRLKAGIIAHEAAELHQRVLNGKLTPYEARMILDFVQDNIGIIVNHHLDCLAYPDTTAPAPAPDTTAVPAS